MNPILVFADSNERGSPRMTKLAEAILADARFSFGGYEELPVDLQFRYNPGWGEHGKPKVVFQEPVRYFNVELKECSDYVASALSPTGHLYQQVLAMRELGHPCMILVLGSDEDILEAIREATKTRYRGTERAYQILSYRDRLIDFEANCEAIGCPVRRWKDAPFKRLLSTANKILTGGNLMSYRPHPANGERELAAAAILFGGNGIGPKTLEPIMQVYHLCLLPRVPDARPISTFSGIGPKRLSVLDKKVKMVYV